MQAATLSSSGADDQSIAECCTVVLYLRRGSRWETTRLAYPFRSCYSGRVPKQRAQWEVCVFTVGLLKARQTACTNEEKWHANQVSSIKLRKNRSNRASIPSIRRFPFSKRSSTQSSMKP